MILLLSGCLTLDFLFLSNPRVDEYVLENESVPDEFIEIETFESTDGTLLYGAWARQPTDDAPVLIYFHGTSSNIQTNWERVEYYHSWGYDVFVFDYRGYGASEGDPTADGVLEQDGLAAVQHVVATTGLAPEDLDWVAISLGASVATHTNDEIAARAVILESMFASEDFIIDGSTSLDLPPGWVFGADFDNVEAIRKITAPVFLIHGLADDFIDPDSALELFDAAPGDKQLWRPEGVGHADLNRVLPDEFAERALTFYGGI